MGLVPHHNTRTCVDIQRILLGEFGIRSTVHTTPVAGACRFTAVVPYVRTHPDARLGDHVVVPTPTSPALCCVLPMSCLPRCVRVVHKNK